MTLLRFFTFGLTLAATLGSVEAVMTYTFADTAGGVVLSYTGSQTFAGETLASMGLLESETFMVNLPGGESIRGQVIPEPSVPLLAGCSSLALLATCRRRAP